MPDTDPILEALENSELLRSLADLHSTAGLQRVKGLLEKLLVAETRPSKNRSCLLCRKENKHCCFCTTLNLFSGGLESH
jgi:hypothetical protein